MPDPLAVILVGLAAYRAARLAVVDSLTDGLRVRLAQVAARRPRLGRLLAGVTCIWCVSVWASGGIVWAVDHLTGLALPVLAWAASATIAGATAEIIGRVEER